MTILNMKGLPILGQRLIYSRREVDFLGSSKRGAKVKLLVVSF